MTGNLHGKLHLPYWLCLAGMIIPTGPWLLWLRYGPDGHCLQMIPIWYTMLLPGLYFSVVLYQARKTLNLAIVTAIVGLACGFSGSLVLAPEVSITLACAIASLTAYGASRWWIMAQADPDSAYGKRILYTVIATSCPITLAISTLAPILLPHHLGIEGQRQWMITALIWSISILLVTGNIIFTQRIRQRAAEQLTRIKNTIPCNDAY